LYGIDGCAGFPYISTMIKKTERIEMRMQPDLVSKVDGWRRSQPDIPPRSEAIRRLIDRGLAAEPILSDLLKYLERHGDQNDPAAKKAVAQIQKGLGR
jgi:hypothetical protein